eukprot:538215-Pelagomonas_calceolata.AAC.3
MVICFGVQWHVWVSEICAHVAQNGHGAVVEGMGSIDSPTYTQEDCVDGDLGTFDFFIAQFTVVLL